MPDEKDHKVGEDVKQRIVPTIYMQVFRSLILALDKKAINRAWKDLIMRFSHNDHFKHKPFVYADLAGS